MNPLEYQIGGDHYLRLAEYQPWQVLEQWYAAGHLPGNVAFLAGEAVVYLARFITCAPGKGGIKDLQKASHTLQRLLQVLEQGEEPAILDNPPQAQAMYYPDTGATGQPCTIQFHSIPPGKAFIRPQAGGGGFWVDDEKLVIGEQHEL